MHGFVPSPKPRKSHDRYDSLEPWTIFIKANFHRRRLSVTDMVMDVLSHRWEFKTFGGPKVPVDLDRFPESGNKEAWRREMCALYRRYTCVDPCATPGALQAAGLAVPLYNTRSMWTASLARIRWAFDSAEAARNGDAIAVADDTPGVPCPQVPTCDRVSVVARVHQRRPPDVWHQAALYAGAPLAGNCTPPPPPLRPFLIITALTSLPVSPAHAAVLAKQMPPAQYVGGTMLPMLSIVVD